MHSPWMYVQAATIGLFGGLLGAAFRKGTDWLMAAVMGAGAPVDVRLEWWQSLLIPTVGAVLAGLVLKSIRSEQGPFGIGEIIELCRTRTGKIQPGRSIVQIVSSGLSIASGGSIGREGANSQFGATIASLLGHWVPNSPRSRTVLLGCGIAAGMASAYKAPIAAAIFVMEVVLGNFAMDVLAPLVVASVVSTLTMLAFFDRSPLYSMGKDLELTAWPLVLSAGLLGLSCSLGSMFFRKSMALGKRAFARIPAPLVVRMALGGLLVGTIGIWFPEVWGNGQNTIEAIAGATADPALMTMVALCFWKVVATAATQGSGALGGVFTPNLVVGAAFGAAFSLIVDYVAGGDHRTEFALIGMAGMCAATTHAPITAMLLIFEMTGDYGLILPLMLCSILGSISARLIDPDSVYTARLRARGHKVDAGFEELALQTNYVRDVMRLGVASVRDTVPLDQVLDTFKATRLDALYVVDDKGELLGQVQLHDVKQFLNEGELGPVLIASDCTRSTPVARPDETVADVVRRFEKIELDELPVVRGEGAGVLAGRITRRDVVAVLSEEVLGSQALRTRVRTGQSGEGRRIELPDGATLSRVPLPDALADRSLASLELPANFGLHVLVVIERDGLGHEKRSIPDATTVLPEGADLIVLGTEPQIERFRGRFGLPGAKENP